MEKRVVYYDLPYDELTVEEMKKIEGHEDFRKYCVQLLRNRRILPEQGVLLDVGCGVGFDVTLFASEGLTVVGLDISLPMLRGVKETYSIRDRVHLVRGDALHLPFRSATFDVVHSHGLTSFTINLNFLITDNPLFALREQKRVCKENCYIIVRLPIRDYQGCTFKPTCEEELKFLFRWAGIKFHSSYYPHDNRIEEDPNVLPIKVEAMLPKKLQEIVISRRRQRLKAVAFYIVAIGRA